MEELEIYRKERHDLRGALLNLVGRLRLFFEHNKGRAECDNPSRAEMLSAPASAS